MTTGPGPRILIPVDGWWCPCIGPGAGPGHHTVECPRRIRIRDFVPSYPAWRPPRAAWLDGLADAEDVPARGPIVRCRPLLAEDCAPPTAVRMMVRVSALMTARLTYAKGWGRRRMSVPADDGVRHFEPWPVESIALRSRALAVAWTRKDGDKSWKPEGGYAVWEGRIWPVTITQAEALVKALEKGARNAG